MMDWIVRHRMPVFLAFAGLVHLAAFGLLRFSTPSAPEPEESYSEILKLVDVNEYLPPPEVIEEKTVVYNQPEASEEVIETEKEIIETSDPGYAGVPEPDYLPQHKISDVPAIPAKEILGRIEYPPIALRQGIEGVVYLELYIDQTGLIRRITVLKDPGFGFADAALRALQGIRCAPARANGVPVAVRFRYPVRFTLN